MGAIDSRLVPCVDPGFVEEDPAAEARNPLGGSPTPPRTPPAGVYHLQRRSVSPEHDPPPLHSLVPLRGSVGPRESVPAPPPPDSGRGHESSSDSDESGTPPGDPPPIMGPAAVPKPKASPRIGRRVPTQPDAAPGSAPDVARPRCCTLCDS